MLFIGQQVVIEENEGQHLHWAIGKRATIIAITKNFVVLNVPGLGIRASLIEYVQPVENPEVVEKV